MVLFVFLAMLIVLIGLEVSAARQLYLWLKLGFNNLHPAIYSTIFSFLFILSITVFISSKLLESSLPRFALVASHYVLAVTIYFMLIINLVKLGMFVINKVGGKEFFISNNKQMIIGAASIFLIMFLTVYGSIHASNLKIKNYSVSLTNDSPNSEELKVALVSDIHLGYIIDEKRVDKFVKAINKKDVDIVLIAGDIFDGSYTELKNPQKVQETFKQLKSKYGVYACLGNHDAGSTYGQMLEFLEQSNITVLLDKVVEIDNKFLLVGRRDSSPIGGYTEERIPSIEFDNPNDLPVIVLDHQPSNINEYGSDVDLVLSGHTHKGQMYPFSLITRSIYEIDYGYMKATEEHPHVIVTSGIGTWGPPIRVLTDSEVVIIDLEF